MLGITLASLHPLELRNNSSPQESGALLASDLLPALLGPLGMQT